MLTIIILFFFKKDALSFRQMQVCRVQFGRWSRLPQSGAIKEYTSPAEQLPPMHCQFFLLATSLLAGTLLKNMDSQGPILAGSNPGGLG